MDEIILNEFKQLMIKDTLVSLDYDIFNDLYKNNLITKTQFNQFSKDNQERWNKLYD